MASSKTRLILLTSAICWASYTSVLAQQTSTNNNDLSYTTLGRRATTINHDNGTLPTPGVPSSSRRPNNNDLTGAGGSEVNPFGPDSVDGDFVWSAGMGALAQIELGNIAAQKTQNELVRKFAQDIVRGHERLRTGLESRAIAHNLNFPKELDSRHKNRIAAIEKLSGPEFDRAYMQYVVSYYERTLGRFDFENSSGAVPDITAW